MAVTPARIEPAPLVLGYTFLMPHKDGGYVIYAWVGEAWRPDSWVSHIDTATRVARKVAGRLRRLAEGRR